MFSIPHFGRDSLLQAARYFSDKKGTCLLYSGGSFDSAQTSFLALFPYDSITIRHASGNPWDQLTDFFSGADTGMAFGFFGYEMGSFSDQTKQLPYLPSITPDAYWQRCAIVLKLDHTNETAHIHIAEPSMLQRLDAETHQWVSQLSSHEGWTHFIADMPECKEEKDLLPLSLAYRSDTKESYLHKVKLVQDLIRAGDVYQINLSQQFIFSGKRHPFQLFETLAQLNPAPFSAYLNLDGFAFVSTSPERLLQKKGSRLETRPIKGTMPRGKNEVEDTANRQALLESPKERSELLMITDLMRNDLGRISTSGSVVTDEIWRCEAYTNVFHLLSVIHSQAKSSFQPLDLIRPCFPGGSITGCPKMRAMEVIHDLEQRPRGIYTGSIGYIDGKGDFDLNVAIRTLVVMPDTIHVQLGGGIVIDSNPQNEYEETLHKGSSLFNALRLDKQWLHG